MQELGMIIVNAWSKVPSIAQSLASNDNTQLYVALGVAATVLMVIGGISLIATFIVFLWKQSQMEKNGEEGKPWKFLVYKSTYGISLIALPWLATLIGTIVGLFYK